MKTVNIVIETTAYQLYLFDALGESNFIFFGKNARLEVIHNLKPRIL